MCIEKRNELLVFLFLLPKNNAGKFMIFLFIKVLKTPENNITHDAKKYWTNFNNS